MKTLIPIGLWRSDIVLNLRRAQNSSIFISIASQENRKRLDGLLVTFLSTALTSNNTRFSKENHAIVTKSAN
jgi:hypothetical protein